MADKQPPVVTKEDFLQMLQEMDNPKPKTLDEDRLLEYAVSALNTLKGLQRADKIKVIRRMRKMLDA